MTDAPIRGDLNVENQNAHQIESAHLTQCSNEDCPLRSKPFLMFLLWIGGTVTAACAGHSATTGSTAVVPATAQSRVTLEVEDRTPKFLAFYRAADADSVSEPQRWAL